jgi:peptidyl-prolyl cis-trans isomerase B (cyclophilin B)
MTSKDRRRRELARERYTRQQQRRAERDAKARRRQRVLVGLLVGALVLGSAAGLLLTFRPWEAWTSGGTTEPTQTLGCAYLPDAAAATGAAAVLGTPPSDPGDLGPLTATLTLNGQPVTVELDGERAPCTVGSWAFLAAADFFDGTPCHRLTTSSTLGVLQCGDPTGTGTGGPGYTFAEENLEGATYPAGTVAMANSGQPGSTGSQFFVVHSDSPLPALYTVVGTVTSGLDVVEGIAAAGTVDGSDDGAPAEPVTIDDLVVDRSGS